MTCGQFSFLFSSLSVIVLWTFPVSLWRFLVNKSLNNLCGLEEQCEGCVQLLVKCIKPQINPGSTNLVTQCCRWWCSSYGLLADLESLDCLIWATTSQKSKKVSQLWGCDKQSRVLTSLSSSVIILLTTFHVNNWLQHHKWVPGETVWQCAYICNFNCRISPLSMKTGFSPCLSEQLLTLLFSDVIRQHVVQTSSLYCNH